MKTKTEFNEKAALKFAKAAGIDQKKIQQERQKIWLEKQNRVLTSGF